MINLEPWMLIVGPICGLWAIMLILWLVACKKAPKLTLCESLSAHPNHQPSSSLLEKWFRRLTTI
jgi:hypothetical protein